jgi:nucleotide-binding universal stress UspA family protein
MNPLQRVFRNSAAPIAAQLINRVMDLGFALVVVRVLGPGGNGAYEYAVQIWLYLKTFTDFGLGVLATRDVARRPELAAEYLGLTTILRLALWATALPLALAFAFANWRWLGSSGASTAALLLLILSIVPDSWSDAANAICNAREEMVRPAILTVIKNGIKTAIGLGCLLAGWGVVGLALTALITNVVAAWLFTFLLRGLGVAAAWRRPGAEARRLLGEGDTLLGRRVLVTAGGTREPLDAVRFVGNRSSGRMGVALADAARKRGAEVTLLAANLAVPPPPGVEVVETPTAEAMLEAVRARRDADLVLMAAAVADYRPDAAAGEKRAKDASPWQVTLQPTTDILGELGATRENGQVLVGFAADHGATGLERARDKLTRKAVDLIVFNDVARDDIGFDSGENEITLVSASAETHVPKAPKDRIAATIIDRAEELLRERG